MKKYFILFTAIVFSISTISFAQWISLDKNSLPDSKPVVQLISDNNTGTVIKVDLPGFKIKEFNADGKIYHSIDLCSLGISTEIGKPEIPHIAKIVAIPDQGSVSVEILETSESQIIKGIKDCNA